MDVLKVCREVRGVPRGCRKATPARPSAMGVAAVKARDTACLHGFSSVGPDQDTSQGMIPSSLAVQTRQVVWSTVRARSARLSRPDAARSAGSALRQWRVFLPLPSSQV